MFCTHVKECELTDSSHLEVPISSVQLYLHFVMTHLSKVFFKIHSLINNY